MVSEEKRCGVCPACGRVAAAERRYKALSGRYRMNPETGVYEAYHSPHIDQAYRKWERVAAGSPCEGKAQTSD